MHFYIKITIASKNKKRNLLNISGEEKITLSFRGGEEGMFSTKVIAITLKIDLTDLRFCILGYNFILYGW